MAKMILIRALPVTAILTALAALTGCAQQPTVATAERPVPGVVSTAPPPLVLRDDHPDRYAVMPGDTIWDISTAYLDQPWRWRELWPEDADVELYPGDVIEVRAGEQPQLQLAGGQRPTIRLSPEVRVETISAPVPTIEREALRGFIDNSVILGEAQWRAAPYIVGGADGRPLMAAGNAVFARGADFDQRGYRIYRPDGELRHPDNGAFLGFSMLYVGEVELETEGDPATLRITSSRREVRPGDRLLASRDVREEPEVFTFDPVSAPPDSHGRILGVQGRDSLTIGRYDTVVISLGNQDGMQQGSVLEVLTPGPRLTDPLTGRNIDPGQERAGLVMLYKIFDRASYGIVVESIRDIRIADRVREPS